MAKYDYIIAIDPDVQESGVATLVVSTRLLVTKRMAFPVLLDFMREQRAWATINGMTMCVVVEAGWVNRPNWHIAGRNARTAAAIGKQTGRNHEVGRLLVEMSRHYGIETIEQPPFRKCWQGKDGKITAEELRAVTGLTGRTNQDERDAALMAWLTANLPVRIVR